MLMTMGFFALGVVLGVGVTIAGGVAGMVFWHGREARQGKGPAMWGPWVVNVEDALALADDLEITGERGEVAVACMVLAEAYRAQLDEVSDEDEANLAPTDGNIETIVPLVPNAAR